MDWKQSLDRYLTTPPNDGFDNWAEQTIEKMSEDFYETNELWVMDSEQCNKCWIMDSEQSNKWMSKLYDKGIPPEIASTVIERTYRIVNTKE